MLYVFTEIPYVLDDYLACVIFEIWSTVLDCESRYGLALNVCICVVFENTGMGIVWLLKCG